MKPRSCRQRGVSLLEVVITLFVFGIGILSVAALQALAKKTNYDAAQHTQAGMLALGLMERLRANPRCMASYLAGDVGTTVASYTAPDCVAGSCTGQNLVRYDLNNWNRELNGEAERLDGTATGSLVSPTGCIQGPADGTSGLYTVAIAWRGVTAQTVPDSYSSDDPRANTCGLGKAAYDDVDLAASNDNRMRRLFVMQSYVANPGGACAP